MAPDRDPPPDNPGAAMPGFPGRPIGRSSRARPDPTTPQQIWISPGGTPVPLPLIIDIIELDPDGQLNWSVQATVGLRQDQPALLDVCIRAGEGLDGGLDTLELQQHFRWNTPMDIVTRLLPRLIDDGQDPFTTDLPTNDYPEVTQPRPGPRLTREFLTDIAREYLTAERPYPHTMAAHHGVTPRTIVSWIEKARKLGILKPGQRGKKNRRLTNPRKSTEPPETEEQTRPNPDPTH